MQELLVRNFKVNIKNIYINNYGCAANVHDLEIILGYLQINGYCIEKSLEKSDLIFINTCGVKKPTEDKILARLKSLSKLEKPIIVAGCLPKINFQAIKSILPNYAAILDPQSIDRIIEAICLIKKGYRNLNFFSEKPIMKLGLPESKLNEFVKIVPISEGCLGKCTYCCTKFARGHLFSFPIDLIVENVKQAVFEGTIEIWLTGQDTGAYGKDIGVTLTDLLNQIIDIEGDFKIRIGMTNPNHAKAMLKDLISFYRDEKIYDFLHLPLQSGSDKILGSMNRLYSVSDVREIIKRFRDNIPDINIATDIIVGFPTELDNDFTESINFIKDLEPDIVNISKFAPRPKTSALGLTPIPSAIIKNRSKQLSIICSEISIKRNKHYLDKEMAIIVTKKLKKDLYEGRIQNYKKVLVNSKKVLLGKKINAKIINSTSRYLEAEFISKL